MKIDKVNLRPNIANVNSETKSSTEEAFQNKVIRPIIKLQHSLIINYFQYHLKKQKTDIDNYNEEQKDLFLIRIFKIDRVLKIEMKSLIIGLFTNDEYSEYLKSKNEIDKRIHSIISKRVHSYYLKNYN